MGQDGTQILHTFASSTGPDTEPQNRGTTTTGGLGVQRSGFKQDSATHHSYDFGFYILIFILFVDQQVSMRQRSKSTFKFLCKCNVSEN